MPLLLTPAAPFQTSTGLALPSVYALILKVEYDTDSQSIRFMVGYYPSEQDRIDRRNPLQVVGLPVGFGQQATPEQANGVPIFQFLEQVLTAQLTPLLGEGATIQNVP